MAAGFTQLVYVSRVASEIDERLLEALRQVCLRNNRHAGITGLLAFDGQRFLQAIEGTERAIDALMARILQDPRHDSIDIFSSKVVRSREFGEWSMNFERAERQHGGRDFQARLMRDVAGVTDPSLQAAFIGFARLTEAPRPRMRNTMTLPKQRA